MKTNLVKLSDYKPPEYLIKTVELEFELLDDFVSVSTKIVGYKSCRVENPSVPLILNGENQNLIKVEVGDRCLEKHEFELDSGNLIISNLDDKFEIKILSFNYPKDNHALEGLYLSEGMYCTQCEPEGFRRITFFPDRPDVMAIFTTKIIADKRVYPVLLSNGNIKKSGDLAGNKHFVEWYDPFPKPSYLFALVAGRLGCVDDTFITMSGRQIKLKIYVEPGEENKCEFAMLSLKRAIKWEEGRFGLEYDLDLFMIVAVSHFNMGAMENKGLNIFNSRYILADSSTASDVDFQRIESIIAHEYFHNWTGNRVTCRDWFQLSLKEGLTVFRDQEFTADLNSRGVKRINDVRLLRAVQFLEDASPTSHPVRPDSYMEINNFYTPTVYEKGAEIVRLVHSLIGEESFQNGMRLYFARHDGQAVTCEEFLEAMQDASGKDLSSFNLWYSQSGTPEITVSMTHKPLKEEFTLNISQTTPPTADQQVKQSLPLLVEIGLFDEKGGQYPLRLKGKKGTFTLTKRLEVYKDRESFVFEKIKNLPIPSLLRQFSSPVKVLTKRKREELLLLMSHETDPFVCWDANQEYATDLIIEMVEARQQGKANEIEIDKRYINIISEILLNSRLDNALRSALITLPSENEIAGRMQIIDVENIHFSCSWLWNILGAELSLIFKEIYSKAINSYAVDDLRNEAMGSRLLANTALGFLAITGTQEANQLALRQACDSNSMTLVIGAMEALNNKDCSERADAFRVFFDKWEHSPLELDKWYALNASSTRPETTKYVIALAHHPRFDMFNPNRIRSLLGSFANNNPLHFHNMGGESYKFLADSVIKLDKSNPQIAARLAIPLTRWKRHNEVRKDLMIANLNRIKAEKIISRDVSEIIDKGLMV